VHHYQWIVAASQPQYAFFCFTDEVVRDMKLWPLDPCFPAHGICKAHVFFDPVRVLGRRDMPSCEEVVQLLHMSPGKPDFVLSPGKHCVYSAFQISLKIEYQVVPGASQPAQVFCKNQEKPWPFKRISEAFVDLFSRINQHALDVFSLDKQRGCLVFHEPADGCSGINPFDCFQRRQREDHISKSG